MSGFMNVLMNTDQFHSFAGGLDHPECVAWGPDGFVYAGGEGGQIYKIQPENGEKQVLCNTGGFILGLALDGRSNVYACDVAQNKVLKITPSGQISVASQGTADRPMVSPNYAVFDEMGALYVTASGIAGQNNALLFRINPDGQTELVSEEVTQNANGLALNNDGTQLYVVLTDLCSVVRMELFPDGLAGSPETVVQLDRAVPDGLAMDEEENLYIGCYSPDVIFRLTPEGRLDTLAEDWKRNTLASPTNLAFGGPQRSTLAVANFARWDLVKAEMDVRGRVTHYPV